MRKRLGDQSVDVVVTSPPYNIGQDYTLYDDSQDEDDYFELIDNAAAQIKRVLSPRGSFFLNLGGRPSDAVWPLRVITRLVPSVFKLQNTILWIKSIAIPADEVGPDTPIKTDLSIGHFKPVNSGRYLNSVSEYVFHLTKAGDVPLDKLGIGVRYGHKSNIDRWPSRPARNLRDRGNVWYIQHPTRNGPAAHPCQFPARLPEMCIKLHGRDQAGLVLDPFLGTGSTAVACKKLGVPFVGFEVDPDYVNEALQRLGLKDDGAPDRARTQTQDVGAEVA